jgi:hypothetical protein
MGWPWLNQLRPPLLGDRLWRGGLHLYDDHEVSMLGARPKPDGSQAQTSIKGASMVLPELTESEKQPPYFVSYH